MNNLKRLGIFLVIFAVVVAVSVSFKGNNILKRSIVLGLGVDRGANGEIVVTAEIVSPGGNDGEQVGTFSKTVTDSGQTVAQALQNIALKTGKETSLGQCVLIVYGEQFIQTDFTSTADYFIRSDSVKENAVVCCCQGTAKDMLNNGEALGQSVSISLADKLKSLSKEVALPFSDLLTYSRSQRELYKTGFLNYVQFVPSQNTDADTNKTPGFFMCDKVAVLRQNKLVGVLSPQETQGFAVLADNISGNVFAVSSPSGTMLTLRANTKKVDTKQSGGQVKMSVTMKVKLARTDSFGAGGIFSAKSKSEISQSMLQQAQQQCEELATLFLQKQVEWDFDIVNVHEIFRQKYGTTNQVENLPMSQVPIVLKVEVKEK